MQESYYSCLVFLFTAILNQILATSRASGNTWFTTYAYKALTSKFSKKQNVMSKKTIFKISLQ